MRPCDRSAALPPRRFLETRSSASSTTALQFWAELRKVRQLGSARHGRGSFGPSDGKVVKRFLRLYHVKDTTSEALKLALFKILDNHKLSISRLRGQGYDGASNMRDEFNGLQRKILDENPYAFYVRCFAHRLQLVVAVASSSSSYIHDFLEYVSLIVNTSSSSCKKMEILLEQSHKEILDRLERGEISTARGLNQQTSLARPGDTRWGSHHKTLLRLEENWPPVIKVLGTVDAH
ncbi:hypothetical protein ACQ4PT_039504 [Festuca glaucescens]